MQRPRRRPSKWSTAPWFACAPSKISQAAPSSWVRLRTPKRFCPAGDPGHPRGVPWRWERLPDVPNHVWHHGSAPRPRSLPGRLMTKGGPCDPLFAWTHVLESSEFHPGLRPKAGAITPATDLTATVLEGAAVKLGRNATLGCRPSHRPRVPLRCDGCVGAARGADDQRRGPKHVRPSQQLLCHRAGGFASIQSGSAKAKAE